jgi:uncharacterized protein
MKEHIESFWGQQRYAVVGVSATGKGFGCMVFKALKDKGFDAYPVSKTAETVMGEKCYRSVADLPQRPEAVVIVVPREGSAEVVRECADLGIEHVWLQQGAESAEGIQLGKDRGLALVHNACAFMYMPGTAFPHRVHRRIAELFGMAPR